jgi:hypothetical protein
VIRRLVLLGILGLGVIHGSAGQDLSGAYDAANMYTRASLDFDSYFFVESNRMYVIRGSFYYGLNNQRHLFGLSVPVVHSIFSGDYAGYENTIGIGDIRFTYNAAVIVPSNPLRSLRRVSFLFDASAPTGNEVLGHGVGTWMFRPGLMGYYRPDPAIAIYPEVRFQFSGGEGNLGGDGNPDYEDTGVDGGFQAIAVNLPFVAEMTSWQGWFSLNPRYMYSLSEETSFLFLRADVGKMLGDHSSGALQISKFIAGQPRLDLLVQVNFTVWLR